MKFQIGKAGVTPGTLESLENAFKTHHQVRISVLKSAGHSKEKIKEIANSIVEGLKQPTQYRVLGFTIILNKSKQKQTQ